MRVIDCECGAVVQAGDEQDLVRRMREHLDEQHPDKDVDEDGLRELVAERSYHATDS